MPLASGRGSLFMKTLAELEILLADPGLPLVHAELQLHVLRMDGFLAVI